MGAPSLVLGALFPPPSLGDVAEVVARQRGAEEQAVTVEPTLLLDGFDHRYWTTGDCDRFVRRSSGALRAAGIARGDRVLVCTSNTIDQPLLTMAVVRAGGIAVPLNHQLSAGEFRHIAGDCGARLAVVDPRIAARLADADAASIVANWVVTPGYDGGPTTVPDQLEAVEFAELLRDRPRDDNRSPPADEVCAILYTSGTTGRPKGARLTSQSLITGYHLLLTFPVTAGRSLLFALPMAHIMGLSALLFGLMGGLDLRYLARFDAERVLDLLEGGVDAFFGVPSMYQLLSVAGAQDRDLGQVQVFASAADVMPGPLIEEFRQLGASFTLGPLRLPALFVELYGSVELSGAAMCRLTLPWADPSVDGFVGLPLPGFRTRVVGDDGRELPPGQTGELLIAGPGVFAGYDDGPEHDADDWFHTGDLASRSPVGVVRFVGREKDVIKSGGYSVYPPEIESRINGRDDVEICAVIGLPHETLGAEVAAVVAPADGADIDIEELLAWLAPQIARYKRPRRVILLPRGEFPLNATGKINKRALRDLIVSSS